MDDNVVAAAENIAGSRLLVIGLDWPAIDTAGALGVEVVVICSRSAARAAFRQLEGTRALLVEDHGHLDDCLAALALNALCPEHFDGVYTTDEFALGACNALAALAGTSRLTSTGDVTSFRDKRNQKAMIRDAGIATAQHWPIADVRTFRPASLPWPGAYVLKPASRAGAMHTRIVESEVELQSALDDLGRSDASDKDFLLEARIDVAKEWVVDGIVFDGRVEFLSVSHYGHPPLTTLNAGAPMTMVKLDIEQAPESYRELSPLAGAALSVLGAWRGAFHMEVFWSDSAGFLFGECGLRRGGAFTHEQLWEKYEFSIVEAAIRCALGHRPQKAGRLRRGVVGTTQLLTPHGTILQVPELNEINRRAGVKFSRYFLGPGSVLHRGIAHGTHIRTAEALVVAADLDEFEERVRSLQEWFQDNVEVAPRADDAPGLREWQRSHFADARGSETTYGIPEPTIA